MKLRSALLLTTLLMASSSSFADADLAKGKAIYDQRCASCHGPNGAGDGPISAALPEGQKPASFVSGKFKKVTDDASIASLLDTGGAALGLSPLMAAQPGMSPEDKANVIAYVRSLKK